MPGADAVDLNFPNLFAFPDLILAVFEFKHPLIFLFHDLAHHILLRQNSHFGKSWSSYKELIPKWMSDEMERDLT